MQRSGPSRGEGAPVGGVCWPWPWCFCLLLVVGALRPALTLRGPEHSCQPLFGHMWTPDEEETWS